MGIRRNQRIGDDALGRTDGQKMPLRGMHLEQYKRRSHGARGNANGSKQMDET
jgi:hypothetical protein